LRDGCKAIAEKSSKGHILCFVAVVAFRLVIPFSFESMFSILPSRTNTVPVRHEVIYYQSSQTDSGQDVGDSLADSFANVLRSDKSSIVSNVKESINPLENFIETGTYIWLLGIMALLVYNLASFLKLKRQLKSAQLIDKNIYEAKNLKTPFVMGIIKPKIYLPAGLTTPKEAIF